MAAGHWEGGSIRILEERRDAMKKASNIEIYGVLLAAGLSTRMGAPKLILDMGGGPLIEWAIRAALGAGLTRVIVVTSGRDRLIGRSLDNWSGDPRLLRVQNPRPELGMASSMRVGLAAVSPNAAGAMILLADQPLITPAVIDRLLAEFARCPDRIVTPTVQGRRTTPVTLPADLFGELLRVEGDVGGKPVLKANAHRILPVELGSQYDDRDVDTPQEAADTAEEIRVKGLRAP